ncbi:MAG: lipoyl(octanoyl) transferase LipB, partial [Acidobacteriota bacterium]
MTTSDRTLTWTWLGRVAYPRAVALQEHLRREVKAGHLGDQLLLLEHDPVYTVGKNADAGDVTASMPWRVERGIDVHVTSRGGQVTYHGPGQLVGYPIIDLNPDRRDVRRYVQDLQQVLIDILATVGIEARRRDGREHIGVWVGDHDLTSAKIASIGVHLSRWVTMHGFALNV